MAEEKKRRRGFRKFLRYLLLIIIIGLVVFYFIAGFTYSEGHRPGVLIKFSRRGYIFKTYEGELNLGGMGNIPNTAQMNNIWEFSVMNKPVADSLMNLEGQKVALHYRKVVKNFPWQGDTEYFVDRIDLLK
jgi:hypothetical protein